MRYSPAINLFSRPRKFQICGTLCLHGVRLVKDLWLDIRAVRDIDKQKNWLSTIPDFCERNNLKHKFGILCNLMAQNGLYFYNAWNHINSNDRKISN